MHNRWHKFCIKQRNLTRLFPLLVLNSHQTGWKFMRASNFRQFPGSCHIKRVHELKFSATEEMGTTCSYRSSSNWSKPIFNIERLLNFLEADLVQSNMQGNNTRKILTCDRLRNCPFGMLTFSCSDAFLFNTSINSPLVYKNSQHWAYIKTFFLLLNKFKIGTLQIHPSLLS